jgi:hypothetical protein
MQKKSRKPPACNAMELGSSISDQLWVRPNSTLVQGPKQRHPRSMTPATGKKLLELADVALRVKKRSVAKKRAKLFATEAHNLAAPHRKSRESISN